MSFVQEAVLELEALGYDALWSAEAFGRDSLVQSSLLLSATSTMTIGTGVATIYARDPACTNAAWRTLSEAFPGRFILGLGSSHASFAETRGAHYRPPLSAMRDYLDQMDRAMFRAPQPGMPPLRVVGANGPGMLRLAAERADGAHPYLTTPVHTAQARDILGPHSLLVCEQRLVLETDTDRARELIRGSISFNLTLPNYCRSFLRMGFSEEDLKGGGSDRMVDALGVWGDEEAVRARIREHHDAGADQVCLQVITGDRSQLPRREWRRLAAALIG